MSSEGINARKEFSLQKREDIYFLYYYIFYFFTHNIIDILEDLFLFFYVEKLVSTSVAVTFV